MLLSEYVKSLDQIEQDIIEHVLGQPMNDSRLYFYKDTRKNLTQYFLAIFGSNFPNYEKVNYGLQEVDWKTIDLDFDYAFSEEVLKKRAKEAKINKNWFLITIGKLIWRYQKEKIAMFSGIPVHRFEEEKSSYMFLKLSTIISFLTDFKEEVRKPIIDLEISNKRSPIEF